MASSQGRPVSFCLGLYPSQLMVEIESPKKLPFRVKKIFRGAWTTASVPQQWFLGLCLLSDSSSWVCTMGRGIYLLAIQFWYLLYNYIGLLLIYILRWRDSGNWQLVVTLRCHIKYTTETWKKKSKSIWFWKESTENGSWNEASKVKFWKIEFMCFF